MIHPIDDEREKGGWDGYEIYPENLYEPLEPADFALIAKGKDAWLPEKFLVIGQTDEGTSLYVDVTWPNNRWFSSEKEENVEAEKERTLAEGL